MPETIISVSHNSSPPSEGCRVGCTGGGSAGYGSILLSSIRGERILAVNSAKDRLKIYHNSNITGGYSWSEEITISINPNMLDLKINPDLSKIFILYAKSFEVFSRADTSWSLTNTTDSPVKENNYPGASSSSSSSGSPTTENFVLMEIDDLNMDTLEPTHITNRNTIYNEKNIYYYGGGSLTTISQVFTGSNFTGATSHSQADYLIINGISYYYRTDTSTPGWHTASGNTQSDSVTINFGDTIQVKLHNSYATRAINSGAIIKKQINNLFIATNNGMIWDGNSSNTIPETTKLYIYYSDSLSTPYATLYTNSRKEFSEATLASPWVPATSKMLNYPYYANKIFASTNINKILIDNSGKRIFLFFTGYSSWQFNRTSTGWDSYGKEDITPGVYIDAPGIEGVNYTTNSIRNVNADSNRSRLINYTYSGNTMNSFTYYGDDTGGFLDLAKLINYYSQNQVLDKMAFAENGNYVLVSFKNQNKIYIFKKLSATGLDVDYYPVGTVLYRWELFASISPSDILTNNNWLFGKNFYITNGSLIPNPVNTNTKLIASAESNGNGRIYIYDSPFYKPYINSYLQKVTKRNGSCTYTVTATRDDQRSVPIDLSSIEVDTGSLPPGLSYNTNNFTISGTPTLGGIYVVYIRARKYGIYDEKPLIIYVLDILNQSNIINGKIKTKFQDYKIMSTGAPSSFSVTGTLPEGLFIDALNGVIYGTPQVSNTFSINVFISKTDNDNTITSYSEPFTINILPEINSDLDITFTSYESNNYTITTEFQAASAPCTFSATNLPAGLSLNSVTGLISGKPTEYGVKLVNITATNAGGSDTKILKINILKITSNLTANGKISEPFTYKIIGEGYPDNFIAKNLPENFYLFGDTIFGTPYFSNTYSIPLEIKRQNKVDYATLTLNIGPFITDTGITDANLITQISFGSQLSYKIPVLNPVTNYTYSATLLNGGALSSVNLQINSSTGVISGVPNISGKISLLVTCINPSGSYTKILNVYVVKITSGNSAQAKLNKPFSYTRTADGEVDYFTVENLPENFYLFGDTIFGTPLSIGTYNLIVKAFKNNKSFTENINLTVGLSISSDTSLYGFIGEAFEYYIKTPLGNNNYSATFDDLPSWLNYDSLNKKIYGMPDSIQSYNFNLTITYANSTDIVNISLEIKNNPKNFIYGSKENIYNRLKLLLNGYVSKKENITEDLKKSITNANELYEKLRC